MMKKFISIVAVLLILFFVTNLRAQDAIATALDTSKLDNYFLALEKNNKAMLSVALRKDGKLIYQNSIGYSSVKEEIKNSESTIFRIGSITKTFTATMILQLIEEEKLSLATKLSDFYPDITNAEIITVSDLLHHRSGIYNMTADRNFMQTRTKEKSKQELLELFAGFESIFQPGAKVSYSNTNYVLLGFIIEELTQDSYANQLKKRISSKLNLTNTYFGKKTDSGDNEAFSYRYNNNEWQIQPEAHMSGPHGAGAIVSTPVDLSTFITRLFNGEMISEESLSKAKEMQEGYGMGLQKFQFGPNVAYGHGGRIDGSVSSLAYLPDEGLSIAITANGINYDIYQIALATLNTYLNVPFEMPDFTPKKLIELSSTELRKYEGTFNSKDIALTHSIKVDDGKLFLRVNGSQTYLLEPTSKTKLINQRFPFTLEYKKNEDGEIQYNAYDVFLRGRHFYFNKQN